MPRVSLGDVYLISTPPNGLHFYVAIAELDNGSHLFVNYSTDAGFDNRYVPMHLYYIRAMDALWATLKNGTALPPSQVVRATPRGGSPGAVPAITAANLPAIAATPAAGNAITISGNTLQVPE